MTKRLSRDSASADETEFNVFTNTMLVFAVGVGIASGISAYSNASLAEALAACEAAPETLRDCMRSHGFVPEPARPDAPEGWQSVWRANFLRDWDAMPSDDIGTE